MDTERRVNPADRREMARIVRATLGHEKAVLWWSTPNPMFGNVSPMWMASDPERERKLRNFIFDAHQNNTLAAGQAGTTT